MVVASIVAVGALFVFDSLTRPDAYETHADVALNPVVPSSLYDDEAAALTPAGAMDRELAFAEGRAVTRAVGAEVPYAQSIEWSALDDTTLRVTTRADTAELAVSAASSAGATYGRVREETATAVADEAISGLEAETARLTTEVARAGDPATTTADEELATTQEQLDRVTGARSAYETGTAYVVAVPDTPCCPLGADTGRSGLVGGLVGLVVGLVLAAAVVVEEQMRHPSSPPVSRSAARVARRLPSWGGLGPGRVEHRPWLAPVGVVVLVVGRSAIYIVQGARFMLDDYIHLYASRFLGVLETSPHERLLNRPGAWLTQTVLFSVSGERPLLLFALLTLLNLGAALALYFAVARFFPRPLPFLVAALWVLMANHSTLTVWAAAGQGALALGLCFWGVNLMSKGRWLGALALLSASILSYELAVAICFATAVVVGTPLARPLDPGSVVREVKSWQRAVMVAVLTAVVWWMSRNPTHPLESQDFNLWETLSGHVSSGLVATDAGPTMLLRGLEMAAFVGLVACIVAWQRGDRGRERGPTLAVAGTVVMALGLTLAVAVPGGLFGLGNRLYGASSVGTAMIFAGICLFLWYRLRTAAVAAAVTLVVVCVAGQFVALRAAHQAGEDGAALIRYLGTAAERPEDTRFLVEPRRDHNGFIGVDNLFDLYPYRLAYPNGSGELQLAETQEEFLSPAPDQVTVTWAQVLGE